MFKLIDEHKQAMLDVYVQIDLKFKIELLELVWCNTGSDQQLNWPGALWSARPFVHAHSWE